MIWPFGKKSSLTDLQRGSQLLVAQNYDEAIEMFLRHARKNPDDKSKSYAKIAECYLRTNMLKEPEEIASGITLISQGNRRSAEYYYRLALQHNPRHFTSLRGLADVLPQSSTERCEILEKAVSIQPDTVMLIDLGDFYRSVQKNYDRAYETYKNAQSHAPKDQTAYLRLDDLCRRMGRDDEAKEWSGRWKEAKARKKRFGQPPGGG